MISGYDVITNEDSAMLSRIYLERFDLSYNMLCLMGFIELLNKFIYIVGLYCKEPNRKSLFPALNANLQKIKMHADENNRVGRYCSG